MHIFGSGGGCSAALTLPVRPHHRKAPSPGLASIALSAILPQARSVPVIANYVGLKLDLHLVRQSYSTKISSSFAPFRSPPAQELEADPPERGLVGGGHGVGDLGPGRLHAHPQDPSGEVIARQLLQMSPLCSESLNDG